MADPRRKTELPALAQPGEIVAGKYRVDRLLGRGGMGIVVAATHLALDQKVALKFVQETAFEPADPTSGPRAPSSKGEEALERFLREARSAAKLRSEHVARVFDVDVLESGDPYIVMELLEGSDLARVRAERGGKLPADEAAEYVLQACEALVEAHALGIVHRDLKPQNLFLTRKVGGAPLVKVLDFGISKASGPAAIGELALTDTSTVLGSPLYMAPEQMRSAKHADARSDVWALGVVLYELCGGRVPFDAESVTELCLKVVQDAPPPLVELAPDVPRDLAMAVMRCLEKDPALRFPNVAELALALEPFAKSTGAGAMAERPWRSFADTARSQGIDDPPPRASRDAPAVAVASGSGSSGKALAPADEKASTTTTWGATSTRSRTERRRSFAGGLLSGIGVCAIGFAAVFYVVTMRPKVESAAPSAEPPRAPQSLASAAPAPTTPPSSPSPASSAVPPTGAVSALPVARAAAGSPARPPTSSLPPASAAPPATAAAPARTSGAGPAPNGAPILH